MCIRDRCGARAPYWRRTRVARARVKRVVSICQSPSSQRPSRRSRPGCTRAVKPDQSWLYSGWALSSVISGILRGLERRCTGGSPSPWRRVSQVQAEPGRPVSRSFGRAKPVSSRPRPCQCARSSPNTTSSSPARRPVVTRGAACGRTNRVSTGMANGALRNGNSHPIQKWHPGQTARFFGFPPEFFPETFVRELPRHSGHFDSGWLRTCEGARHRWCRAPLGSLAGATPCGASRRPPGRRPCRRPGRSTPRGTRRPCPRTRSRARPRGRARRPAPRRWGAAGRAPPPRSSG